MFAESAVSKTWCLKAVLISALVRRSYLGAVSFRDTEIDEYVKTISDLKGGFN